MTLDDFFDRAGDLSPSDRAALAHHLLLSLEAEPPDPEWEESWAEEIERRSNDFHSGKATLVDWRESIERIRQSLRKGQSE
jgi:putative addiction module component (TIGR02574 family)